MDSISFICTPMPTQILTVYVITLQKLNDQVTSKLKRKQISKLKVKK